MDYYQISSLIISRPENSFSGEIFVNEEEIETKGSLIIIIEIESNKKTTREFINKFLEIAYQAYKQSIGINTEKVLEDILLQLNQKLANLDYQEKSWPNKINCLITLIKESQINFTAVGNIKAFLVREHQIMDLLKEKIIPQNLQQIFTTIISGNLEPTDAFLLTTPALIDFISLEKIKNFIVSLPPLSASENFKNLLETASPFINFLAVIIKQRYQSKSKTASKIISYPAHSPHDAGPSRAQQSIDNLLNTQKQTANIIKTPSFFETIVSKINSLLNKLRITKKQTSLIKLTLLWLIGSVSKLISRLFNFGWQIIKIFIGLISGRITSQAIKLLINQNFAKLVFYLKNLSKTKKVALIIFLTALLFLSQNLLWQSRQQNKIAEENNYQANLTQIKNYSDTIEAALIYNDQSRAQEIILTLIDAINNLPKNTDERQAIKAQLQKNVDLFVQRVWKLVQLNEPLEFLNLALENKETYPKAMEIINDQLIIFANNNYWITPQDQPAPTINNLNTALDLTGSITKNTDNSILLYTATNQLYSFKNQQLKELTIQYSPSFKNLTSLDFFGGALYLLDKTSNQIYKHSQINDNFGPGLPWVKDPVTGLNSGASLTIDGNLYVLMENGEIHKFLLGKRQDFPALNLYPNFSKPTKIFTNSEVNNIYLLDPQNKRLVVINKNNELQNQYTSEKFDNLTDFVILENEKKAYLLNGDKVYVISLF